MGRKVSIVIPTWNHFDDLLKPCIDSIEKYTSDKYHIEYIVISNGSFDSTHAYCVDTATKLNNENRSFKYEIITEQLGFTKAANVGFKLATADHVIILNNDVEILDFGGMDTWLDKMFAPFDANAKVAASGPLRIFDNYSNRPFLVGFCVMYRTDLLKAFGYFDEAYAPAGGEDVDLCIRLQDAGWETVSVQETKFVGWTNTGDFPMWHKDNRSYKELPEYTKTIVKRNGHLNLKRHNKNIKLDLGAGGLEYPGFISVDLYDSRAQIIMDITKPMDFATDSVSEIQAIHVIEHISPYKVFDSLTEWLRVLKPGGKLALEMPNIEEQCKAFVSANKQERYGILNVIYGSVNTTDSNDPTAITAPHLFGWYPEILVDHLQSAGYVDIKVMPEQIPHPHINFRVEAYKRGQSVVPQPPTPIVEKKVEVPVIENKVEHPNMFNIERSEVEGRNVVDVSDGPTSVFETLNAKSIIVAPQPPALLRNVFDIFPNDSNLVLKMKCTDTSVFLTSPTEDIRKFSTLYLEIPAKDGDARTIEDFVKYLADIGFEPTNCNHDMIYTEVDHRGEVMKTTLLSKSYKFRRTESPVPYSAASSENPYGVTAYISTKDRYFTTLPLAIMGIANQTFRVDQLIIFDDGEHKDLRQESMYSNILRYLELKGISWSVVFGERKGQVANHQLALDMAKTEYIWRVDDDNYPEPEVLARLMLWITCPVEAWEQPFGAVGSLVRVPHQEVFPLEKCSGDIQKSPDTPNLQWSAFSGVLHTDHLHNTFLYRKSAARHGYPKNLSPVGHREETMFTHGIRMNGYRLLACGDVVTWHFRESKGGIRSYNDEKLWEHDEQIFKEEMKSRGVLFDNKKYVVLDNGIGDHYAFKHILPQLIAKHGKENVVLATCFPEVFEDDGVRQISIAEAHALFGDLTKFNIYHWMWKWDWKQSIGHAFHAMYLL